MTLNGTAKLRAAAVGLVLLAGLPLALTGCGDSGPSTGIRMPKSSSDFEDENYQDVVDDLQEAGFTHVETKPLEDLITGLLHKDGSVDEVAVDGDSLFSTDDRYPADAEIVVSYHSFPTDEEDAPEPSRSPVQSDSDGILTVENNADLAALLAGPDVGDGLAAFSDKYRTKTIVFDGYVANVAPDGVHGFVDVLILAGDFGATTGPNFQVTGDPSYAGSHIPENISAGQNIRITALVGEYNDTQGLFHLVPVSIEIR